MKRILSAALALCMVLSLSVTVFATPGTELTGTREQAGSDDGIKTSDSDGTSKAAEVSAAKIGDSISATIEWNDMSFVFDVGANKWRVSSPNGNRIVLTNDSSSIIYPKYEYKILEAAADNSIGLFDEKIATYTIGDDTTTGYHALRTATPDNPSVSAYPSGSLGQNVYEDFYLMFTGKEGLNKLSDLSDKGSLQKVGTLHISIKTSPWS